MRIWHVESLAVVGKFRRFYMRICYVESEAVSGNGPQFEKAISSLATFDHRLGSCGRQKLSERRIGMLNHRPFLETALKKNGGPFLETALKKWKAVSGNGLTIRGSPGPGLRPREQFSANFRVC